MPVLRTSSRTFVGLTVVAAALMSATNHADARDRVIRIGADRRIARRTPFADMTRDEMLARATAAGPRRVRGGERLSGRIFADGLRFEGPGAVIVEADVEIFSHGDVVIDAPILGAGVAGVPRPKRAPGNDAVKAKNGANYAVVSDADVVVMAEITQDDGERGADATVNPGASGQGGDGGDGGSVSIKALGTVSILVKITPGNGGHGGDASVTGKNGGPDEDGQTVKAACGGKGGNAGDVVIKAKEIVFVNDVDNHSVGKIVVRAGGSGGLATARGGDGGEAQSCDQLAPDGGDATARGGAAGDGTNVSLEAKTLKPATHTAADVAVFDPGSDGGAAGGTATATGGKGSNGVDCKGTGCPAKGRSAALAGDGGDASATGGTGATGAKVGGKALAGRTAPQAEGPPGYGGDATARGGAGGIAGSGEDAKSPGDGGRGGVGGKAKATGGTGGASTANPKKSVYLLDVLHIVEGGKGGDADARGGNAGDSGDGGACCENPGGGGGRGGKIAHGGKATAVAGRGGKGANMGDKGAVKQQKNGDDGAAGRDGLACPAKVNGHVELMSDIQSPVTHGVAFPVHMTFTSDDPAPETLHVEICCDGRKIFEFDVVVPAGTAQVLGVATPNVALTIAGRHAKHRISIMVKQATDPAPAKTVKNHFIIVL